MNDNTKTDLYVIGNVDVARDYEWAINKSYLDKVPVIYMTERVQTQNEIVASLKHWALTWRNTSSVKFNKDSPFKGLYISRKTENNYSFPFLSNENRNITTRWDVFSAGSYINRAAGDQKAPSWDRRSRGRDGLLNYDQHIKALFGAIAEGFSTTTQTFEKQKVWRESSSSQYSFSFPLFNTISPEQTIRNRELIFALVHNNIPNKRTYTVTDPAVFYTVNIPGLRFSPACYINKLSVTNEGSVKTVMVGGKYVTVPEYYVVNITLEDLIPEYRNFHLEEGTVSVEEITDGSLGAILDTFDPRINDTNNAINAGTLIT